MQFGFGNINHVTLAGRLTRDLETRTLPSGTKICEFSIAINDSVKRGNNWEEVTYFFDCVAFGKSCDTMQRFLRKGDAIGIVGRLKQDRWQDKNSGQHRSKVVITADSVQRLAEGKRDRHEGKRDSGNQDQGNYQRNAEEGEKHFSKG
jgi:single-strand DNA-binding protein